MNKHTQRINFKINLNNNVCTISTFQYSVESINVVSDWLNVSHNRLVFQEPPSIGTSRPTAGQILIPINFISPRRISLYPNYSNVDSRTIVLTLIPIVGIDVWTKKEYVVSTIWSRRSGGWPIGTKWSRSGPLAASIPTTLVLTLHRRRWSTPYPRPMLSVSSPDGNRSSLPPLY